MSRARRPRFGEQAALNQNTATAQLGIPGVNLQVPDSVDDVAQWWNSKSQTEKVALVGGSIAGVYLVDQFLL